MTSFHAHELSMPPVGQETIMAGRPTIDSESLPFLPQTPQTLQSLLCISMHLNATLRVEELLDVLVQEAMALIGTEGGVAGVRTPDGMVCHRYFRGSEVLPLSYCWPAGHGLPGWLLIHRRPYLTNDVLADAQIVQDLCLRFGVRSALSTPIVDGQGEVLGFFELHNKRTPGGFTSTDQDVLLTLSRLTAVALRNALLYEQLQHSEERYRRIVDQALIGILQVSLDGRILQVNPGVCAMLGYQAEELVGQSMARFAHPDDQERDHLAAERARISAMREQRYVRKDGQVIWVKLIASSILDTEGESLFELCLLEEITERKALEREVAAQASEREAVIAAMADGIYVYDASGQMRWCNPAAQAFNPYTQQTDYLARPFPERFASFLPRDEQGQPFTQETLPVARVLRGEVLTGVQVVDTMMRTMDGEDRLYNVSGAPIRDEAGGIRGAVIVMRDVTERRRLERESAAQARQLSILFEAVPDAITVFDWEGRIVQLNESARQLLARYTTRIQESAECRHAQVLPRSPDGFPLTEQTAPTFRILRGETLTGARAQDVIVRTFEDEDLWLSVTGAPLYDDEGHLSGAVAVTRDLTEQHRAAQRTSQALHALLQFAEALVQAGLTQEAGESEQAGEELEKVSGVDLVAQRLAALMSQVLDYQHVSLTTFEETTREPRATVAFGLTTELEQAWRERRTGFTIHELVAGTDIESRVQAGEAAVIDLGKPPFSEHPTAYGFRKMLLVPMCLEGRLIGVVTFDHGDATHDYGEDEQALARALAQLAALTLERKRLFQERTQAQAMVLALGETNRLMDEFIGIAGHELRTPLTTIKGSVGLVRRQVSRMLKLQDGLPAEVAAMLTTIQSHLDRTERQIRMQNRLVSDLLEVARIHANRLELYPDLCDLMLLVRESVEDQHYLTPTRTLELAGSGPGEALVMADADRVRQVISNYLSNALKYSEADKPVEVRLELVGNLVRVSVRDEGPGLSRAQQQRVWERFYRVPEVEVKAGSGIGLGLGLHISRMIIERLGGQVGVQSAPGKGSTFWFTLPLAEAGERE